MRRYLTTRRVQGREDSGKIRGVGEMEEGIRGGGYRRRRRWQVADMPHHFAQVQSALSWHGSVLHLEQSCAHGTRARSA